MTQTADFRWVGGRVLDHNVGFGSAGHVLLPGVSFGDAARVYSLIPDLMAAFNWAHGLLMWR